MTQQPSQRSHEPISATSAYATQAGRGNTIHLNALLHQYLLQVQGGRLYPEHIPVNTMESVLDLGCGAGEWIFDLAKRYPRLRIYGIDTSAEALHQAKVRRNTSNLRQIELRHMDFLQGFSIPDACVDFVHMRRFAHYIQPQAWPTIINECVRVLRPNGWLNIVELELCEISSPACMTIHRSMLQARAKLERTLGETGSTLGIAQHLYAMLLATGLYEVGYDVFTIDLGTMGGHMAHILLSEVVRHAFIVKPLIVQQGVLEDEEFDTLVEQAHGELQSPDLCGWALLLSAYGRYSEERT
ncbi:MAG: hypothetical protein NVS4B1_35640 [Ktedonobacteraceae bacterium]